MRRNEKNGTVSRKPLSGEEENDDDVDSGDTESEAPKKIKRLVGVFIFQIYYLISLN